MVETLPPDSAKTYSEMFRVAAANQDVADYHDAIAGRDVGRIGKNFARSDVDPQTGDKGKDRSGAVQRTLDWLLLNDADYALAHTAAMGALVDAERAVTDGLADILDRLADERASLAHLADRAARLPDGTLVFRNADGDVVDADNNPIPDEFAAGIEWRGDEPSYEEYRDRKDRIEQLEQAERELRGIETELGDIRGELTNQQEPPTQERLGELEDRVDELRDCTQNVVQSLETPAAEAATLQADALTTDRAIPVVSMSTVRYAIIL